MEFGARQCKPKNPDCSICPFKASCLALKENKIDALPVKLKKTKVTNKYFNFVVIISKNEKTVLEQRKGSGIWQNLYQFPLIETEKPSTYNNIKSKIESLDVLEDVNFDIHLYNDTDIVHKLSHQHLHTKFWIVSVDENIENGIDISSIEDYPVPILIGNFIDKFNF